ncbi:hypothetical protein [Pseudohongiella sp. O18]|uniref:hypothetical protein n=1 Tax=Pseudohongiella sp. O18 TaxID=2904248 RepID=UPI001F368571|nr:hypothetical protein [Pseudohongiella sp. O18]
MSAALRICQARYDDLQPPCEEPVNGTAKLTERETYNVEIVVTVRHSEAVTIQATDCDTGKLVEIPPQVWGCFWDVVDVSYRAAEKIRKGEV